MDGDTMEGFLAHPEQLSDASKTVDRCSDDLTQAPHRHLDAAAGRGVRPAARNYAELDSRHAKEIGGVTNV
jgi:hypothetical protein